MKKKADRRKNNDKFVEGIHFPAAAVQSLRALGKWPPSKETIAKIKELQNYENVN
jgi:hypothetical protein